jgi:hypothetical protein
MKSIIFILLVTATPLGAGTQSGGGGGTLVKRADLKHFMLLDLYLASTPHQQQELANEESSPGLSVTPFSEASGLELLDLYKSKAFEHAKAKLLRIANAHTVQGRLAQAILGVLEYKIQIFYTFKKLRTYEAFHFPESDSDTTKTATAVFYDQAFGPIVYAPYWNDLSLTSQAGLLIHEALRYFQVINPDSLTDEMIQHITATIILEQDENTLQLGAPLLETLRMLWWNKRDEIIDGVRFRLYYRWVRKSLPAIREEIALAPQDLRDQMLNLMSTMEKYCAEGLHEAMEIRCATSYAMVFTTWLKIARSNPEQFARINKLRLADEGSVLPAGESLVLWRFLGRKSPFAYSFYLRLLLEAEQEPVTSQRVNDLTRLSRALSHPNDVRNYFNQNMSTASEKLAADAMTVAELIQNYLQIFVSDTGVDTDK